MFFLCFKNFFVVVGINFSVYNKKTTTTTKGRNHFLWIILYNNWNKIPTTTKKKISFFFHLILLNFVNHSRFVYLFVIFHHYFSSWLLDDEKSFCFFFFASNFSDIKNQREWKKNSIFMTLWATWTTLPLPPPQSPRLSNFRDRTFVHGFIHDPMMGIRMMMMITTAIECFGNNSKKKNPSVFACSIN